MRRKWTIRTRQPDGAEAWTAVEVRDGLIYIHRSATAVVLTPEELQRLRDVFQEAQMVALYDRGEW